jgi:hypothetical protein
VSRAGVVALALGLTLAAGCAAGPPPEYLRPQGDGVTGRVGAVVVTNALLAGGEGGTAEVRAVIVNEGDAPDRLVTVTSPVAVGGTVDGDPALPARGAVSTGYPPDPPPPRTGVVTLRLTGLTTAVRPGLTYPVDLTFARAGALRLEVPVVG